MCRASILAGIFKVRNLRLALVNETISWADSAMNESSQMHAFKT